MNTIQIHAYRYEELSDTAKEKVKAWLLPNISIFDEWDRERWEEDLAALGYEDCDFAYSVSYSQGDGASIACNVNVQQFIKRNKLGNRYRSLLYWLRKIYSDGGAIAIKRSRWGHYVHDKLLYADANYLTDDLYNYDAPEKLQNDVAELETMILEEVQEQSRKLYRELCEEDMYHYSDEYMIDMCEANEYLFDQFGNPVHHLKIAKAETNG